MSELLIYSTAMFWAGVLLTKAVFYFQEQLKKKHFYLIMSAALLQVLDSVHSVHEAAIEYNTSELKKNDSIGEKELKEYLKTEREKVLVLMEVYTLLFLKAVPSSGRKFINYRSWSEAKQLIKKLRGLTGEKNER
jgi:hypothetical protein